MICCGWLVEVRFAAVRFAAVRFVAVRFVAARFAVVFGFAMARSLSDRRIIPQGPLYGENCSVPYDSGAASRSLRPIFARSSFIAASAAAVVIVLAP